MPSSRPTNPRSQDGAPEASTPLASFSPQRISLQIRRNAVRAIKRGELWVYQEAVTRVRGEGRPGDIAVLYDHEDKPFGLGLYDPNSPLRVQVLSPTLGVTIDAAWMRAAVRTAIEKRRELFDDATTNGYRVIHGPGDGLPGLVADRYADTIVIKCYSEAWLPWLPVIAETLRDVMGIRCGVLRLNRHLQSLGDKLAPYSEGKMLWGRAPALATGFIENGIHFEVDPRLGQKTGFFLDQRENRARVEALAAGQEVLNVFCYTGGFSLYAARGRAKQVVSIDASKLAMDALERNIALNRATVQKPSGGFLNICGDAFVEMENLQKAGRRFGMVIVDPPSFAKRNAEVDTALVAYRRLARLGASLLRHHGVLVFASCSSRITMEHLEDAMNEGAKQARVSLSVFDRVGHPADHPIADSELQYLKCIYARLL